MLCEMLLKEEEFQICGVHAILNLSGIYMKQVRYVTVNLVREVINCWQVSIF